ncbi:mitochondrial outer membrane translocase complex, subunit Tom5 [Xylaria sp. CBS 124048]|nr:mitochondrial outer membrane translocase complex, subunit Tom5 [Xylaria sp. CBS 124048]
MFGGFAPPPISEEDIRLLEDEASFTVKSFFATAAILYISPFIVEAVSNVF